MGYIFYVVCVSVILLRLYLCAFNDTQPHIVVDVLLIIQQRD